MSNINKEFEDYWDFNISKDTLLPKNITNNLKEFCRKMFVDIVVKERQKK